MKKLGYLLPLILSFACNHDRINQPSGDVSIHLITYFDTSAASCQIDPATVTWDSTPFISYENLASYNPKTHVFELTQEGVDSIKSRDYPVHGTGFALLANEILVYTGYFYPAFSSQSCNWLVIDPLFVEINSQLKVKLGYPGEWTDGSIPDFRNDDLILDIFRRDGKLID